MKQIINKKTYDTKTAELIASWNNNLSNSDFNAIREELYLTKKGAWFFCYWGGANTCYSETAGNCSSEGSGIKVMSSEEAYKWLESNQFTEAIEKYFSSEIEEA